MNRRKLIGFISMLIPTTLFLRLDVLSQVSHCEWKDEPGLSPHGEAISLVIETQRAQIEQAEAELGETAGLGQ